MNALFLTTVLSVIVPKLDASLSDITKALGAGNIEVLSGYFDENVEITILDKEDTYNRDQAIKIIQSFFQNYEPSIFSQVHAGISKNQDSQFCIGNLTTNKGVFRVYIYLRIGSSKSYISELKFNKE